MDDERCFGIVGTGSYLPSRIVSNAETAAAAGVTEEWILRKTGIRQRHRAAANEATSDLAAAAAEQALRQAGLTADQISYIVLATSTPDHPQPPTANITQHLLGARNAAGFDINAVCSGFVFALSVANQLLRAETRDTFALVIGADIYSRVLDPGDRRTAILFGDGAGAAVLGRVPAGQGVIAHRLLTHADHHRLIGIPAGGSRLPASAETISAGEHHFRMEGREVSAFVQEHLPPAIRHFLADTGIPSGRIDHFIPHQANGTMLATLRPALHLDSAAMHLTLQDTANTGAASIPIALDTAHRAGLLAERDTILLAGFGGGMSIGCALLRWTPPPPGVRLMGSLRAASREVRSLGSLVRVFAGHSGGLLVMLNSARR